MVGAVVILSCDLLSAQSASLGNFNSYTAPVQAAPPDSIVSITAEAQGLSLVPLDQVPSSGTFWWVMQGGAYVPMPCPPQDMIAPIYQIADGQFLADDTGGQVLVSRHQSAMLMQGTVGASGAAMESLAGTVINLIRQVQTAAAKQQVRTMALAMGVELPSFPSLGDCGSGDGGGGYTNNYFSYTFDTNLLWLDITNVSNGFSYLDLHNGTNLVYAIWSTTNLLTPFSSWQVETEVWPKNGTVISTVTPFVLQNLNRQNLFLRAEDWTGITQNGNTTPDWWLWKFFGTTALSDTNLDSLGHPLVADYQNHVDPNIIFFSLQFPTKAQAGDTNGTVFILGGQPFYEAVLINDTNTANAVWQPYTGTNVAVSLNSGNGVYTIRVGLRGLPPGATTTWVETQLTLYQPPVPAFVITSPVTTMVSMPMIQLQGQISESLSSLTFDVSNATGVFTNQSGYWQPTFYDTNVLEFTGNTFECYDVQLTNGLNIITLHVTDLAGNSTTTNVSFTLDYSTDINPPALNIVWPQAGTQISGTNFTLQAQVGDATAAVTACIIDSNGDTNSVQGLVERSGQVWVENLPLAAGTNLLKVTATDAAGHLTTTNLILIQSVVTVTMDSLSSDQLNQSTVWVTGTCNDTNSTYCIYVNGLKAYYTDDSGDWEADGVAVSPTGTALFDVEVYVGDPVKVGSQIFSLAQSAVINLMSYSSHYHSDATAYNYCSGPAPGNSKNSIKWLYTSGGAVASSGSGVDGDCHSYGYSGVTSLTGGYNGYSPAWEIKNTSGSIYDPPVWDNGAYFPYFELGGWSSDAHASVMILPGGQTAIGQMALYLVQAQVMDEDSGLQLLAGAVRFLNQMAGTTTEDVTNADGSVWSQALVSAPAGVQVEVTPQAAGNYSFTGMKLSRLVYISVDTSGEPGSFNASDVRMNLQSQLGSNVFDNLPAGQGVQVMVHENSSYGGNLGWNNSKNTYVNRVDWKLNAGDNIASSGSSPGNFAGGETSVNPANVQSYCENHGGSPTTQTWVNILAHEVIWLNASSQFDQNSNPDGEISKGKNVSAFVAYTVLPTSRLTIRKHFGF